VHGSLDFTGIGPSGELTVFDTFRQRVADEVARSGADIMERLELLKDSLKSSPPKDGLPPSFNVDCVVEPKMPRFLSDSVCWISMVAASVDGELGLTNARLCAPPCREGRDYDYLSARFALKLQEARLSGTIKANGDSVFLGGICLYLAQIGGEVWLGGALLVAGEGAALEGQSLKVGGIYAVGKMLFVLGALSLPSATIRGDVSFRNARLHGVGHLSCLFDNSSIEGALAISEQTVIHGGLSARRAHIRHDADLSNSVIIAPLCVDAPTPKPSIDLEGSRIDGSLRFNDGTGVGYLNVVHLLCDGEFSLANTKLFSLVDSAGLQFYALLGMDAHIRQSAFLGENFEAHGSVFLQRMQIDKDFSVCASHIQGSDADDQRYPTLDLSWCKISGNLVFADSCILGRMDLTHADVATLSDQISGYKAQLPDDGSSYAIGLNGLVYNSLLAPDMKSIDEAGATLESDIIKARTRWLEAMPEYSSQPYVQLANILQKAGMSDAAREIVVRKKRRDLRQRREGIGKRGILNGIGNTATYVAGVLFGWLFNFGLGANKAIATLFLSFLSGWLVFSLALERGALIIDQQAVAGSVDGNRLGAILSSSVEPDINCGDTIRPSLYALDVFIPLIDLRQESECEIGAASDATGLFSGFQLTDRLYWLSEIELYRYFKALYTILGWVFISLSILTFTGVLRPQ